MSIRSFLFDNGKSRKYWRIGGKGKSQTIEYGRVGCSGKSQTKTFETSAENKNSIEKLVKSKIKNGYVELFPEDVSFVKTKRVKPATTGQIRKLEKAIGCKLPADYVSFLKTINGGYPEPPFISIPGHPYIDNVDVCCLFGLYEKVIPGNSISWAFEVIIDSLPKGHFPIASSGDIYTLCTKKTKFGCIYFWDHEADLEIDEKFRAKDGFLLATNFTEFLGRISLFKEI